MMLAAFQVLHVAIVLGLLAVAGLVALVRSRGR